MPSLFAPDGPVSSGATCMDAFQNKEISGLPPGAAGKRLPKKAFKREFPRSANAYLAEAR